MRNVLILKTYGRKFVNILGVHIGHDSGAALVKDGKIISDVSEERFNRIKHYSGVPIESIDFCLSKGNLTIEDINIIATPNYGVVTDLNYIFDLQGNKREKRKRKLY